MTIRRLHFVIDKLKSFNKKILYNYKNFTPKNCDVLIVFGGDGFMLHTLKKYQKYKKPFYGINTGTFGFLMNKYRPNNLYKNISRAKLVKISQLQMNVTTKTGKVFSSIAINEISLLRQTRQTASLEIKNNKKILIKKLICDGVLISTPAGSTAYNLSVRGPILSLNSKKLALTAISPFRPRRWKGKIIASSSIIVVKNLNIKKRSVSVVADNFEVRNVKKVKIKVNNQIKFKLLYDKSNILSKKIKLEQRINRYN